MKIKFAIALLVLGAGCAFCGETVQGSYAVELTPSTDNTAKGTDKGYPDVITIKDGKLTTEVSSKQGFKAGECEVRVEGEKIKITATLAGRGKGRYELELQGDKLSGKLIWDCDPGSAGPAKHAEYSIAGKKKKAE